MVPLSFPLVLLPGGILGERRVGEAAVFLTLTESSGFETPEQARNIHIVANYAHPTRTASGLSHWDHLRLVGLDPLSSLAQVGCTRTMPGYGSGEQP